MKLTGHFFLNSQFQRYDAHPEQAHPSQPIAGNTPFTYWASLPPEFQSDIDDVINISNSKDSTAMLCFFKGSKYLKYDIKKAQPVGQPAEISEGWPGLKDTGFDKGIDAASEWAVWGGTASAPDASTIMFFKGDQYISCTPEGALIEQTPQPISKLSKDFIGDYKNYTTNLDCVLLWCNEEVYFFKKDKYVRLNVKTKRIEETIYPISRFWKNVSLSKIQAAVLFDETLLASQPADTGPHTVTGAGPAHKDDECHCGGEQHTHHHHYHGGTHQHCHGGTHHHHHGDGQGTHTSGNTGPAGGPNTSNTGPAETDPGNTTPRPVPSLPKGQFTVTLVNNENWLRTATLNIDGKEQSMDVAGHKAVSRAFTTTTGQVTIALYDSKHGAMRLPLNLPLETLGATGRSMTFGAEKPTGEALPAYMDVFVHIDWTTDVKN